MEFVGNDGEKFYINKTCSFIKINGINYNVIKVCLFTEINGKFETDIHIVKYSKNQLFLYNKNNVLLNNYKFSKLTDYKLEKIIKKFILKKDYYIELYDNYIINNNNKEQIISINYVGVNTVYISEFNNKLSISLYKYTFNGIPIGIDII